MAIVLAAAGAWLALGTPSHPEGRDTSRQSIAVSVPAPTPRPPAAGQAGNRVQTVGRTEPNLQPDTKPPLPTVIRPGVGQQEGNPPSTPEYATLPTVIRPTDRSQPTGEAGTGFFISSDGSAVTAAHVVRKCSAIFVVSRYLKETPARLLAIDYPNDVAVLQIRNMRPPGVFALADRPRGAANVAILGYPGDGDKLVPTETRGRLRTERPSFDAGNRRELIWIDANAVRGGFSGGPILNVDGDVVGAIDGHIIQRTTSPQGEIVSSTKYVFGVGTNVIKAFMTREVPSLIPDARTSPPLGDSDKAVLRVMCIH
ncbi:MAG: serine protease [Rhodospirillales bacterium]